MLAEPCAGLNCSDFGKECVNDGFVTLVNGVCACLCPPGLDPKYGCARPIQSGRALCLFLSVCLSACPSVCQTVVSDQCSCLCPRGLDPRTAVPSLFNRVGHSVCVCLPACLFACLSVCLPGCPSVSLSVRL